MQPYRWASYGWPRATFQSLEGPQKSYYQATSLLLLARSCCFVKVLWENLLVLCKKIYLTLLSCLQLKWTGQKGSGFNLQCSLEILHVLAVLTEWFIWIDHKPHQYICVTKQRVQLFVLPTNQRSMHQLRTAKYAVQHCQNYRLFPKPWTVSLKNI